VTGTGIINDFPRHLHDDLCAGIVTSGERSMDIAGSFCSFSAGDLYIINPGEPHSINSACHNPHSYVAVIIPGNIIREVASDVYGNAAALRFSNCITGDSELSARFIEFADIIGDSDSLFEAESALFSFLEYLVRYHSAHGLPDYSDHLNRYIKKVKSYIDENYKEEITLGDLSDAAGVSPFHLSRLFSAETGISLHSYLLHKRIECSKALLLAGYSIAFVSSESGFSDQSHYTKLFKKITGTTPGRYKKFNS